jgi:hypothetical protein
MMLKKEVLTPSEEQQNIRPRWYYLLWCLVGAGTLLLYALIGLITGMATL